MTLALPLTPLEWEFRDHTTGGSWRSAMVPGCVHRDLLAHDLIPDPFFGRHEQELQWIGEHEWEYRADVEIAPEMLAQEHVELVADGLDTLATVFLNDVEIARTENMFTGYRWDVQAHLRPGRNALRIVFASAEEYVRTQRLEHTPRELNDPVGGATRIRKEQCQFGWDWGPRFVTAGIWQDLRLEAWSGARLETVRVEQAHADGEVSLQLHPETAGTPAEELTYRWSLVLDDEEVATGTGLSIEVPDPQLWWPNGHGGQPLYTLAVEALADGEPVDRWSRRLGLRTIALDRTADGDGERFAFVVNGKPIFAKGANWIPAHSFVAGLTRADYARDLESAAEAHMTMIRVWGGGIYEAEPFYDLCDELGLLVWQDFMFSCTLYPGDEQFLALVREEAHHQVRRLRHRACLALWCGNNEIPMINREDLAKEPTYRQSYDAVFHALLPEVLAATDPVTPYWPSSPHREDADDRDHAPGELGGDTHFWDVWHLRQPVSDYQKWHFRFVSEYGMQAYCTPATQATFCPPEDANVFGATMENHQKNRAGNQIILDYVSRRYRFPKSQEDLLYLSQLNQAFCVQTGAEFHRRISPHCMGSLYWQLNDCWPVASWSSIEFTGQWRALHYAAKRFFAPALVTAQLLGEEHVTVGNYRHNEVHGVELFTVSDLPEGTPARLFWTLFHLDGERLKEGERDLALAYGRGIRQTTLDLRAPLAAHGAEQVFLRLGLEAEGQPRQEETVFLTAPRFLDLRRGETKLEWEPVTPGEARLHLTSSVFQHRFALEFPGFLPHLSDNFFELYPGETRAVEVRSPPGVAFEELQAALRHRSLVDAYA
ncbi:MAG: beta-mannosidase [Opitutales bacterium]